jgi:hypothetical protein
MAPTSVHTGDLGAVDAGCGGLEQTPQRRIEGERETNGMGRKSMGMSEKTREPVLILMNRAYIAPVPRERRVVEQMLGGGAAPPVDPCNSRSASSSSIFAPAELCHLLPYTAPAELRGGPGASQRRCCYCIPWYVNSHLVLSPSASFSVRRCSSVETLFPISRSPLPCLSILLVYC